MTKSIEAQALELIEDLHNLSPVLWYPCDYASDYCCRYCGVNTKSNIDHSIDHAMDCLWLKIEQLEKE